MIIELVGLPGSGKTTYARQLCNSKRFTRVRIGGAFELLWYNLFFILRFPIRSVVILVWCMRYRGPRSLWYTKFTSIYLDYNAKYMKARRFSYAVLDQGHLQLFMSLFENTLSETARQRLLQILPKADHYVFFTLPEHKRLAQLGERGYHSREGLMTDSERTNWQQTAATHFHWLLSKSAELAPATTDTVTEKTELVTWSSAYETAKFMRYVTFARMPTEKAHGLQIATMCAEFTKQGHFISLITPKRANPIPETVTEYYQLDTHVPHQELNAPDVIGRAKKVTPVHHYLHEILFALAVLFMSLPQEVIVYTRTPLVAKIASLRGKQVVIEMHYWPEKGRRMTAWLIKEAKVIANSDGTAADIIKHHLKPMVAHNGFPSTWLELNASQAEAREKLGIKSDLPVIMYVGSLGDWKGVDTLCEASKLLNSKIKTVVIGGNKEEILQWQVKYPEVFFLGSRPYTDLGYNQRAADVLVVPNNPLTPASERHTSPIKLFAHLASNRPVVVSDLPTMRAVVDEKTVWFFKPGDPSDLAKTIETAISDESTANQKIKVARNLALNYTWEKRTYNLIRKVLATTDFNLRV